MKWIKKSKRESSNESSWNIINPAAKSPCNGEPSKL